MEEYNFKSNESVYAGIHDFANQNIKEFPSKERQIVGIFKRHWYVTKADSIKIGSSEYRYFLIKAPNNLANQFNIELEIIVLFSEYEKFEPRTLVAFENIKKKLEIGRVENLCGVIISPDNEIEKQVKKSTGGEARVIIPFTYDELTKKANSDSQFIRSKFQKYFYERDLFAFNDALKTDLYFFGREQLVLAIIDKHLSGENSGLFGLRKTGKTSIIFDVKRRILLKGAVGIFVSCQNTTISEGNWVEAITEVVKCIYNDVNEELNMEIKKIHDFSEYKAATASRYLEDEIRNVIDLTGKSILVFFDEVEHITYAKSSNKMWGEGTESVSFWKTIRSISQKFPIGKFSFSIVGTNPVCIEYPTICDVDNPIFKAVKPLYIPGFNREQTREMVRTLGRFMGVKFDESIYQRLTDDYGGHPFLIRHVCSYLSQNKSKPFEVSKSYYDSAKLEFNKNETEYFDMILNVLEKFYNEEYELLQALAVNDLETFNYFVDEDPTMIKHLVGYDLIKKIDEGYEFKMEVIKDYIIRKEKLNSKKLQTKEDKWAYLAVERGKLETSMREMVMKVLYLSELKSTDFKAKEYVMKKLHNSSAEKRKYGALSYIELFNPNKANIYFKDLSVLICGKWDLFEKYIEISQEEFKFYMSNINSDGRGDAHAKDITKDKLRQVEISFEILKNIVNKYQDKHREIEQIFG